MKRIKNLENKIIKSFALIFLALALISLVSSAEASYCCEKTTNGAWCQNQPQSNCDSSFKMAPTSCDSTSYCKTGCCFDSQEGLCMENTPQKVCETSSGTWAESPSCEIPQCNLGCCVLADQGAFVTLTRCRQISGFYGLTTDFRKNIADELSCISAAQQEDKGACVFEDPQSASKTCKFGPRKECPTASYSTDLNATINVTSNKSEAKVGFYKDVLCTAEELGTQCAPSTKTMLVNGKDEVYWQDTCGNPANIYDASKYEDHDYWKKVYTKEESCGAGSSNAGSSSCGNCDYYLGSIGREASRAAGFATYGDYVCLGLNCKAAGKKHGESWCLSDSPTGNGLDTVGSRYYKEVCIYGEVLTEPCADFRNERCIQGQFGSFSEAACRVNRWRDCTAQQEKEDCGNYDQRDCHWIDGYYFSSSTNQIEKSTNDSNGDGNANDPTVQGLCMPNYPPGFQFWGSSTTSSATISNTSFATTGNTFGTGVVSNSGASSALCNLGNSQVTFKWVQKKHPIALGFLEGLTGVDRKSNWECNNSYCKTYVPISEVANANISIATAKALATDLNKFCYQLGDCGGYINWIGQATTEGYAEYVNNRRVVGTGGAEILQATAPVSSTSSGSASSGASSAASTASGISNVLQSASQAPGVSSATLPLISMTGNFVKDFIEYISGGEQ
jgi:hypothetical protein